MMPRRTTTRAHDGAARIDAERQRNQIHAQGHAEAERGQGIQPRPADADDPPPF
jgi:hypothetical protein